MQLAGGVLGAQAISVLASPVLTHIYSPETWGEFAVFMSVLLVANSVCSLRYEFAVTICSDEGEVRALSRGVLAISAAITAILTIGLLPLVTSKPLITSLILLAPAAAFLETWRSLERLRTLRAGDFATVGVWDTIMSGLRAVSQIALGVVAPIGLTLVSMHGLSRLGGAVMLRYRRGSLRESGPLITTTSVLKRYRRFALLATPAALLNAATSNSPVIVLAWIHGPEYAGLFALSHRVFALPLSVLGTTMGQEFFAVGGKLRRERQSLRLAFRNRLVRGTILSIAVVLPLGLLSPLVIPTLFGSEWAEAGWIIIIMLPAYILRFISSSVGTTLEILERQDLHFAREIIRILLLGAAYLYIAGTDAPPVPSVAAISIASALGYATFIAAATSAVKQEHGR